MAERWGGDCLRTQSPVCEVTCCESWAREFFESEDFPGFTLQPQVVLDYYWLEKISHLPKGEHALDGDDSLNWLRRHRHYGVRRWARCPAPPGYGAKYILYPAHGEVKPGNDSCPCESPSPTT